MSVYLGPSSATRWLKCTASPGYLEREKDRIVRKSTDYADEGNEAHDYADAALKVYGLYDYDVIPDPDMRKHVRAYVEFVLQKVQPDDQLFTEQKLPLFYMPDRNGKVDVAIVGGGRVDVTDLKYGRGISVEAVDNPQCAIYAKCVLEHLSKRGIPLSTDTLVSINIYQPRAQDGRVHREWNLTLAELNKFCEPIGKTAVSILQNPDGGEFFPEEDKVCRFCDAKEFCGARAASLLGELPENTSISAVVPKRSTSFVGCPAPQSLTLEQVSKILQVSSYVKAWIDDVCKYADSMSGKGTKIPGFKVVEGRGGHRKWTDEAEAARVLGYRLSKDEIFPKKIISPAKAVELLESRDLTTRLQRLLDQVITKPEGGPTLVPESDPRQEYKVDAAQEFSNLNEGESLL